MHTEPQTRAQEHGGTNQYHPIPWAGVARKCLSQLCILLQCACTASEVKPVTGRSLWNLISHMWDAGHISQCPASNEVGYSIHRITKWCYIDYRIFVKFRIIINAILDILVDGKHFSLGWVGCDRSAGRDDMDGGTWPNLILSRWQQKQLIWFVSLWVASIS